MEDLKLLTEDYLIDMGASPALSGFRYIADAVELAVKEPHSLHEITKAIYPTVAQKNHTTASCVERGIRHAIERLYTSGDVDSIRKAIGPIERSERGKPTNADFVAAVALKVGRKYDAIKS